MTGAVLLTTTHHFEMCLKIRNRMLDCTVDDDECMVKKATLIA